MSLKLGWYRCVLGGQLLCEVRCVADDIANPTVAYIADGKLQVGTVGYFQECFEFVSVEKPETWVPADPSKITLEMLPLTARFRDGREWKWSQGRLVGFQHNVDYRFLSNNFRYFKYCEILENQS